MHITIEQITDGLLLLFLAATIFFAIRLSMHLKSFREGRKDMQKLLGELSQAIVRAENAIDGLRQTAREAGRDLQEQVNEANGLADELRMMTESGDNIASRLEKAVSGRRHQKAKTDPTPAAFPPAPATPQRSARGGFSIRDPEYDTERSMAGDEGAAKNNWQENESPAENLTSRAEQELYDALRQNRKKKTEAGGVP